MLDTRSRVEELSAGESLGQLFLVVANHKRHLLLAQERKRCNEPNETQGLVSPHEYPTVTLPASFHLYELQHIL